MTKKNEAFRRLIAHNEKLPPLATAVVHPCDPESLRGAVMAWRRKLIEPVLVGPEARIRSAAARARVNIRDCEIVSTEHSHASAGHERLGFILLGTLSLFRSKIYDCYRLRGPPP